MRKYTLNENYFENIDTEDKAYFLGLIAADGCVMEKGGKLNNNKISILSIQLAETDSYLLKEMQRYFNSDRPIYFIKSKVKNNQNRYSFMINSEKICLDLKKYNIIPRKSLVLQFPEKIPEFLLHHFIRGYMDGDGSVCSSINGRHVNPQIHIKFYGNEDFLISLRNILKEKFNLKDRKLAVHGKIRCLTYGGNNLVKVLYDYLYKDATIFMTRKEEKMKQVFNYIPYSCRSKVSL